MFNAEFLVQKIHLGAFEVSYKNALYKFTFIIISLLLLSLKNLFILQNVSQNVAKMPYLAILKNPSKIPYRHG